MSHEQIPLSREREIKRLINSRLIQSSSNNCLSVHCTLSDEGSQKYVSQFVFKLSEFLSDPGQKLEFNCELSLDLTSL